MTTNDMNDRSSRLQVPLLIGLRYIGSRQKDQFISFISLISLLGLMLGVTVLVRSILGEGMLELTPQEGFPKLPDSVITLLRGNATASPAIACLADFIVEHFRQFESRVA